MFVNLLNAARRPLPIIVEFVAQKCLVQTADWLAAIMPLNRVPVYSVVC